MEMTMKKGHCTHVLCSMECFSWSFQMLHPAVSI